MSHREIEIRHVSKSFGDFQRARRREPRRRRPASSSRCSVLRARGKTTLLRIIAGLETRPTRARSCSQGEDATDARRASGTSASCSSTTRCSGT